MLSDTSVTKHKHRALFTLMKGSELFLDSVPTIKYQAASFGIRNIILKINIPNRSNKALWRTPESNEFIDKIGPVETNQHKAPLETIPEAKILCCLRQGLLCQYVNFACLPRQRRKREPNILILRQRVSACSRDKLEVIRFFRASSPVLHFRSTPRAIYQLCR